MATNNLFIYAFQGPSKLFWVNIETLVVLFIYKLARTQKVNLVVKLMSGQPSEPLIEISLKEDEYTIPATLPEITTLASGPVIVSGNQVTAGICSVARSLIKMSPEKEIRDLLGFREACLLACSENSIWTRFCEVDIIQTVKNVLRQRYIFNKKFELPIDFARFEYHMSTPVRMHNVYKEARVKNNNKAIISGIPMNELNLHHTFSEGSSMTLSDVILYQCYEVLLKNSPFDLLIHRLPLTVNWFNKMEISLVSSSKFTVGKTLIEVTDIIEPNFVKQSLYKADPSRYRPEKRVFTKQNDIEHAFEQLEEIKTEIVNEIVPFGHDVYFSWSNVPLEANPRGGALPKERASRKSEQLKNLTKAVIKIAKNHYYKIVDFCSGSGHLGILLATLLPNCEIVLVENKERSLMRAKERIEKLGLSNVLIVQSNLDYFQGDFDIGVALHACGVATDLVIQNCVEKKAHLVVCPCCYGGVRDCHHLTYPRSNKFKKIDLDYNNYLNLAHGADQTHDDENVKTKQGYFCMDAIDTDRKFFIESFGYKVFLGKLEPTTCTNKNNLLVGLLKDIESI